MLSAPERMAEKAASVSSDVRCRSPEMRVSMKGLRLADCDILDCFDCFSVLLVVGDAGCGLSVVGSITDLCTEYLLQHFISLVAILKLVRA